MKTVGRLMKIALGIMIPMSGAYATDRTWDGGSSVDSNWSSANNWSDNTAPVATDTLFFAGAARTGNNNDYSEWTAFSGITFNSGAAAFTLGGNGITLDGDIANLSGTLQTIDFPMVLNATRTVSSSTAYVTLNGVLSGAGGLNVNVSNGQGLNLAGDNTYEGFTTINNGCKIVLRHSNGLGATSQGTRVIASTSSPLVPRLYLLGNIEVPEPIYLNGRPSNYDGTLYGGTGSNVISGCVYKENEARVRVVDGATLVFKGGVVRASTDSSFVFYTGGNSSSRTIITDKPIEMGSSCGVVLERPGTLILAVGGNTFKSMKINYASHLRTDLPNVFPSNAELQLGYSGGSLDMNGNDQEIGTLTAYTSTGYYTGIKSTTPATLTVNHVKNSILPPGGNYFFDGDLEGAVRFVKQGSATLLFRNRTWTTTGDIVVKAGTLEVDALGSFTATPNVRVEGGTLKLGNGSALPDAAAVKISAGATLDLAAGITETVDRLYLDGAPQSSGTWGATGSGATHIDDTHFSGTGVLNVLSAPVSATWDAGGADQNISTALNWVGDVTPAFNGYTFPTFGTGGSTAVVDTAVSFGGITFNRDADFTLAAGSGDITNGAGGITATVPTSASRTYAIAGDLALSDYQTWEVNNNGEGIATLDVSGVISDGGTGYGITKMGDGVLKLSGDNTYGGQTTVETDGYVVISHGNALGSAQGTTRIEDGGYIRIDGGSTGITVPEPLWMTGDAAVYWRGTLRSNTGSNTWSGKITSYTARIRAEAGSMLEVTGGVDGQGVICSSYAPGYIRFSENPLTGSSLIVNTREGGIILAVGGNTFSTLIAGGSFLRVDVPNAWPATVELIQGVVNSDDSGVDLNGNDQTVGNFRTGSDLPKVRSLFSAAPATLTVNQSATTTHNGSIDGAVSLVKLGTGTLTFTGTHTTSGGYTVSNGVLAVGATGSFGVNSTNIVVGGNGTLQIDNSAALADSAVVHLPEVGVSTAKIDLADGVEETVGWLFLGEKMQPIATYGATGSGAIVVNDDYFTGTGVLKVKYGLPGTLICVR